MVLYRSSRSCLMLTGGLDYAGGCVEKMLVVPPLPLLCCVPSRAGVHKWA